MPEITTDDGVRLHYVIEDYCDPWRAGRETVLLYHGYLKSLEHWTPFVPAVARHYRVVRFDVRGAGQSSVPRDDAEWSVDRLIGDAVNLMDALGMRKVHWAGFESAGILGLLLARNSPERIASVACFNTPYRSPGSENTMKDLFRCGFPTFDDAIDELGVERWVRKLCEAGVLIDPVDPAIVEWVVQQAAPITPTVAHEWHRVFGRTSSLMTDLERVDAPVLLVAGANHVHGCEPPLLDRLRSKLKHAREVVYVPGVAIGVQLLKADECARTYLEFLRGIEGTQGQPASSPGAK